MATREVRMSEELRIRLDGTADLKRPLVEKIKAALSDDEMLTSNRDPITIPPVVIDSDPTDDMEITLPPIVIDSDPTDDMR
jgi:hypothetical protein